MCVWFFFEEVFDVFGWDMVFDDVFVDFGCVVGVFCIGDI